MNINDNKQKLFQRLNSIQKSFLKKYKIGIFLDFDECVLNGHLSRNITEHFSSRVSENFLTDSKNDCSVMGISKLFDCYKGLSFDEFQKVVNEKSEELQFYQTFETFWDYVLSNDSIVPIFVSSGISIGIESFFQIKKIPFDKTIILADTIKLSSDRIILGADMIIGEKEKGTVVNYFRDNNVFEEIVTIGHSAGDRELIKAGDEGFRLSFKDKTDLSDISDYIIENWRWDKIISLLN